MYVEILSYYSLRTKKWELYSIINKYKPKELWRRQYWELYYGLKKL